LHDIPLSKVIVLVFLWLKSRVSRARLRGLRAVVMCIFGTKNLQIYKIVPGLWGQLEPNVM